MTSKPSIIHVALAMFVSLLTASGTARSAPGGPGQAWFAGRWNATRYRDWNFNRDHPLTVALRIEVFDANTDLPLGDAEVRLEGRFREVSERVLTDNLDAPDEQEFRLVVRTGRDGLAVFALSWQDEKIVENTSFGLRVRDRYGLDDIFKGQMLTVRREGYQHATVPVTWFDEFRPPYKTNTDTYIEDGWLDLIARTPRAKCVLLHLPDNFGKFGERSLADAIFFEKLRAEDYSKVFDRQVKADFDWNPSYKPLVNDVGPFMVVPVRFYMQRIHEEVWVREADRGEPQPSRVEVRDESGTEHDGRGDAGRQDPQIPSPDVDARRRGSNRRTETGENGNSRRSDVNDARRLEQEQGEREERQRAEREERERRERDEQARQKRERARAEVASQRPLGVAVDSLTEDNRRSLGLYPGTNGVVVLQVEPGSPADAAGLSVGMVIESVDHRAVGSSAELDARLRGKRPGDQAIIGIWEKTGSGWQRDSKVVRLPG